MITRILCVAITSSCRGAGRLAATEQHPGAGARAQEYVAGVDALRLQPVMVQMKQMLALAAMAASVMLLIRPLQAEVLEKARKVGDTTVQYKTVLIRPSFRTAMMPQRRIRPFWLWVAGRRP
jgi:hypothetical protein